MSSRRTPGTSRSMWYCLSVSDMSTGGVHCSPTSMDGEVQFIIRFM